MLYRIIVTLLFASVGFPRLQEVSALSVTEIVPSAGVEIENLNKNSGNDFDSHASKNNKINSKRPKAIISWGSHDTQTGNVYGNSGGKVIYGPQDTFIGNNISGNPDAQYMFGPVLIQKNNDYNDTTGKNTQYGLSLTQVGNAYPENPGQKDVYAPVVIQEGNNYPEIPGNNTVFGAVVIQKNNTYPKSVEMNKDVLNPIIVRSGNIFPVTPGTHNRVVTENDNHFHPTQKHQKRHNGTISLKMVKRRHRKIKNLIHQHMQVNQPTSMLCENGIRDLVKLDRIERAYNNFNPAIQRIAFQDINLTRKDLCNFIAHQCSLHADMQERIARSRLIQTAEQSNERLKSF